ncbi:MAG: DUF2867 domain-containing protein [Thermoleophilia bacterium]
MTAGGSDRSGVTAQVAAGDVLSPVAGEGLLLVTGATGYVGGRLVPRLLADGYRVRCLTREAARLGGREWADRVEIVEGDVLRPATLSDALSGVSVAYYLVHSMAAGTGFRERDLAAASGFAAAAAAAGVGRIIYLGGLGDDRTGLSAHLRSRQETGMALRRSGPPVTEFRAAIVVGAGSISFEMIRYLSERLPVMVCPKWVFTRVQPIGIETLLDYLVAALAQPASAARVIEIGDEEVLTYAEMMMRYARIRGLRRRLLPVPVLTPTLSSYWVHLVTPIPSTIARPLIEGLGSEVIVRDSLAVDLFPHVRRRGYDAAVRAALANLDAGEVESVWSDALVTSQGDVAPVLLSSTAGMISERRQQHVAAPTSRVFATFCRLGGRRGYLFLDSAWRLRGAADRLVGGVGLRRGRRDPDELRVGDALDFWRVEAVEAGRLLRLRAEMKVPGPAWLQFEAKPDGDGTLLIQTAYFAPKGLAGLAYWYGLYPIHSAIFSGMMRKLAGQAEMRPAGGQ